jgi:hypothetical protein
MTIYIQTWNICCIATESILSLLELTHEVHPLSYYYDMSLFNNFTTKLFMI